MAYYDALVAKWNTLTGTDEERLAAINAATVAVAVPMIIPSYEIYESIDGTEFNALSAANQARVRDILNMGSVNASPGTQARALMMALFGSGTATRTKLTALVAKFDSRAQPWWSVPVAQGGGGLTSHITLPDLYASGLVEPPPPPPPPPPPEEPPPEEPTP
jgi:hypothetical protein